MAHVLRATVGHLAAASFRTRGQVTTDLRAMPAVVADEGRLGQVFMNLLVNALDALADGDPASNRVEVRGFTDGEGQAVVEVEDNGRGIPPDVLPRIFEPFFTTKGPRAGSGLGLAICHRIVGDLGGRIEVSSPAPSGTGALFRVVVPAGPVESAKVDGNARPRRRLRVLIVDDEPSLARALALMLEEVHEVDVAMSGEEAVRRLGSGAEYDVILCDLMMAGVSGIDVYDWLESNRPLLARRLVFMTGGAFSTRAQQFLARVTNTCLDKPFTPDGVRAALEAVWSGRGGRRGVDLRVARSAAEGCPIRGRRRVPTSPEHSCAQSSLVTSSSP